MEEEKGEETWHFPDLTAAKALLRLGFSLSDCGGCVTASLFTYRNKDFQK